MKNAIQPESKLHAAKAVLMKRGSFLHRSIGTTLE
jgi:hypothetical protein